MPDIFHSLPIQAPVEKVFAAVSTAEGFDKWWSKTSNGKSIVGERFHFHFEPDYNWTAVVSKCVPDHEFELTIQLSDSDWEGSKVGFQLSRENNVTVVRFYHTGWKEQNDHFCFSSYCWAMYLRLLKRNLELGEIVPYSDRLSV